MPRHYVYRMDHDTGFAPHVANGMCTLCGCKKTTIEAWATPGNWVIGIGGHGTGKPDALVYALKVDANPTLAEFQSSSPKRATYLSKKSLQPSAKVLVGHYFYYFGINAILLPRDLKHLLIRTQGCKRVADKDVGQLDTYLARHFDFGVHGTPNNRQPRPTLRCVSCRRSQRPLEPTRIDT